MDCCLQVVPELGLVPPSPVSVSPSLTLLARFPRGKDYLHFVVSYSYSTARMRGSSNLKKKWHSRVYRVNGSVN